jgi:hypothetical protein
MGLFHQFQPYNMPVCSLESASMDGEAPAFVLVSDCNREQERVHEHESLCSAKYAYAFDIPNIVCAAVLKVDV